MADCITCTQKARQRQELFDQKKEEAKAKANEQKETTAVCKKTREGEFFVCTATEAVEHRYIIVDFVSFVQ